MAIIQIPVLFDMSGDTITYGEEVSGDFIHSHLNFMLDMTTEANDISLNAADISSAVLVGDNDYTDNIFYAGGSSGNIAVDNLCNRIAKTITRGKLVHIPKSGNHSNSGIPLGGRAELVDATGTHTIYHIQNEYTQKYFTSVAPIGDEQMLGEAMARVASIHLVGSPLSAGIFENKNSVQTDLEVASGQTFNSGNTAFYNALAVQLSKVLGGSKSSAPMNNGLTNTTTTTTFNAGTKITANDGGYQDQFGYTVDVSGNYAIIGSPNWDVGGGNNEGAAYIFNVTTGAQLHKLTADDGAEGDTFGYGAAIDGNYAIVGAYSDDDGGNSSGSAYVFDVTTGNQLRKLTGTGNFGQNVAISGNYAIISAEGDNDNGSAYIFNVTNGNQVHKLASSDGASNDDFGYSVSIDGNNAIVSTMGKNSYQGAAYIFNVTTGNQVHKLTASDGQSNDYFGRDSSIYGNYAIVGAGMDDDGASDSGSVYIFDITTGNQLQKLTTSDPAANERFGHIVAITDNYFVVGKPYDTNGSAYIFTYATNTTTSYPLDASGVSCPALKSIYEQLMNVPGRSQIMETREVTNVPMPSGTTLAGGFPFIAGDKLVMYLRPKINFAAQTLPEQHTTLVGMPEEVGFSVPVYDIGRKNSDGGALTGQTYTQSSMYNQNANVGFNQCFEGTAPDTTSYWLTAGPSNVGNNPATSHGYGTNGGAYTGESYTRFVGEPKDITVTTAKLQNTNEVVDLSDPHSVGGFIYYNDIQVGDAITYEHPVNGTTTTTVASKPAAHKITLTDAHDATANNVSLTFTKKENLMGEWGQVDIGQNTAVKQIDLWPYPPAQASDIPKNFHLLGSADGTNWDILKKVENEDWGLANAGGIKEYAVTPSGPYRYYRISVQLLVNNASNQNFSLSQMVIWGGKHPTEFYKHALPLDISGLVTNFTATPENITSAFPGKTIGGPDSEELKWGWMGSTTNNILTQDTTDITDTNTIDLHVWKITITL